MTGSIVGFPGGPRRRVVVTFPLSRAASDSLQRAVGAAIEIVDIRDADGSEGLVVVSAVSPQLLGRLHAAFPDATLFVVEVEDGAHRVDLAGPVMRALDAGADGYMVARSIDELGSAITHAATAGERDREAEPSALPAPAGDRLEHLDDVLDAIIRDRAHVRAPRAEG